MAKTMISERLEGLHYGEERLRGKALGLIASDERFQLHMSAIEHAMDLADVLRQYPTDDEDFKVIQALSMQTFNAFGASVKLMLSGYFQSSVLNMRAILETVFLMDLFHKTIPEQIERWRHADRKERIRNFGPVRYPYRFG